MATQRILWTVAEAAEALGYRPDTVYRWARRGKIPARRIGRNIRFVPREIEQWAERSKRADQ